jgi:2-oxoglutarate ferredoxin oxidoreductase subunit gamma
MQTEIVLSGFGGQGVLFAGQLLAYAAMDEGRHVTWIPSYGPEMRGGTAHCTVIISDDEIGSPLVRRPQAVIALNLPSRDKYAPLVAPGGVLVVNASLVPHTAPRDDIRIFEVPANDLAEALGNARLANVVLIGALLAALPTAAGVSLAAVDHALSAHLPERHKALLDLNYQALRRGAALVSGELLVAATA